MLFTRALHSGGEDHEQKGPLVLLSSPERSGQTQAAAAGLGSRGWTGLQNSQQQSKNSEFQEPLGGRSKEKRRNRERKPRAGRGEAQGLFFPGEVGWEKL